MAEDRSNSMENKVDHKSDQPCELSHKFLKKITNDFDESLIVGSGTFGIVYKGTCENGEKIAVKVLKNTSGFETTEELHKELKNLRRLKHQNVVKLVGFCNESEKVVAEYNGKQVIAEERHTSLCFEYVCNGSLAKHIYADACSGLNWHILYNIIKGICQGLEYLRHGLEFSVWHLDLKPANILLDNNMIPKLADVGLSKLLFGDENTRKSINHVGTGGYLPPEYMEHGLLTKEFDIFGLGVIIVKLMAGREVYFEIDNMSENQFINHVYGNWRKKLSETLAPSRLEVYCEQVRTCIKIALKCMNCNRQERPSIQFIVSKLIETEILIPTEQLCSPPAEGNNCDTYQSCKSSRGQMAEDNSMGNKVDHDSDQPCQLSHEFLKKVTNDFDESLIVGRGTFGIVYKGTYENGEEVAVKVLKNTPGFETTEEFHKELKNLRRLKHQNVVKLVGFCNESEKVDAEHNGKQVVAEQRHTSLCFEYVCNGSLGKHIHADGCSGLNWHILYNIIKGICQGLEYLRHGLEFSVWHLDLKPANILLDNNMIPKLADFGLSKLLSGDEKTRNTKNHVGTFGYLPPEYIKRGLLTKEFDIFGLGVIITKLMAGREVYSEIDNMSEKKFIHRVHGNWRKKLSETLAPRGLEVYCAQVRTCIQIALKCMNCNRQERPSIQVIVSNLIETETLIRTRGLQMEQFRDEEPIRPEGHTQDRTPEMAGDSGKGKADDDKAGTASAELKGLPLELLKKITNDFSMERILGTGAFGTVYKGTMEDGEMVAVKKLAENAPVARDKAFFNEAQKMSSLKHENVVHLVGACHEMYKKVVQTNGTYITADIVESLLCYEYLPKGSLQKNLFELPSRMGWDTRFKIIKGVCQGLLFLHSIPIVHMDLKPENILLDNKMRPKIADFGLSRLFGQEQTRMNTPNIVGSYGYIAPEYLYRGEISTKLDIYSLGLLILETTTGERNIPKHNEPSAREFIENVHQKWTLQHIPREHPFLDSDGLRQVQTCIEIGLDCIHIDRRKRPSIKQIIDKFDRLSQISSDGVLSLQPQRINFPIKPKRLTSSSLYLINKTDDRIAFRVVTKIPKKYRTKLPFCGIVLPKCTYTLNVITPEQKKVPPSDSDDSLTLQNSIALHEDLDNVDPASVAMFLDTTGDEMQEAKVVVACEPLAETVCNQIIDGQNYRDVLSIDVHPTEPWILTSNQRGYVCLWNYQTQAEVLESTEVSREPVYSVKFIEREEWCVAGSGDGSIYVYDYTSTMEEVINVIEAHDGHGIKCLAVNPTSSFVLSASDDHTIKLWDWTNGWQCIRTFEGHDDTVIQVMFDPRNSESFASVSLDRTIKIWNIHSATCNITLDGHQDGLLCVHYHPQYFKQFLVSGSSDGVAKVWDLETDTCVDTLQGHTKGLSALCWHPELRVLVTGSLDGTVQIWKSTSTAYKLENIIRLNLDAVHSIGYLKGLTRIVVGCDQGIALMEINVL